MRTVLNRIRLFIDNAKSSDSIFISKQYGGEDSKIAKRQNERERVRQRIAEKGR
jgi:hypothetical protein